jgi:cyclin B
MRLKMIDWMIEVFYNLKCKDITFFTCVNIMDRFFILTKKKFKPENLHLIGICSIFIASKFCEVYPIKLINLIEKVGHNKFSKNDILNMEKMILECLNYDILRPYSIDFAEYFFEDLFSFFENNFNIHNKYLEEYLRNFIEKLNIKICLDKFYFDKCESVKKYNEKMRNFLWLVIIYLLKMCNHDYELIQEKPSLIAASSILVGMRICEILNNENYVNELFIENLSKISKENQYNLLFCSSKILTKAQNFHKENNDIHNLYNTHFEMINQIHFTQ